MGFLKKYYYLIIIIFLSACSASLIKINVKLPSYLHPIYGNSSQRNFYYSVQLSDSIKSLWRSNTYGGFNNSSVVLYDSLVFVADLTGRVYTFNINNGKQLGVIKTKGTIFSTPLVFNYRVYYPLVRVEDKITELIVYDFFIGKEIYRIEIEDLITNQILYEENYLYLISDDGTVYKYSLEMNLIWKSETYQEVNCVPALNNNDLFIGNSSGELLKLNKNDGKIIIRKKLSSRFLSGITISSNTLFIGDDEGNLLSLKSSDLKLNFRVNTNSRIIMNPVVDESNIFIGNLAGDFFCYDKFNGNIKWSKKLNGLFNSTPIATINRIIVPDSFKAIWILDKTDGTIIKKIELEGRAKLSPVLVNNKLIIGYDDGILEAYEFN